MYSYQTVTRQNNKYRDGKVLEAYIRMLLDGTAFCNWNNPPDSITRQRLVEHIVNFKEFDGNFDLGKVQKVVMESRNEAELKRMLEDMEIKEDDFKV